MRQALLFVALAGAVGGLGNAILDQGGVVLPKMMAMSGSWVLVPGFLGNLIVGGIAAVVSWCLYGPFANLTITSRRESTVGATSREVHLPLAALAGALLVGFSGGRWMTAEADKRLNHGTAVLVSQAAERALESAGIPPASLSPPPETLTKPIHGPFSQILQTESALQAYQAARELSGRPVN